MLAYLANRHRDHREARRVSKLVGEGRQLRQWIVNVRGTIMEFNELSQILEALNEVPSIPDEILMLLFIRVRYLLGLETEHYQLNCLLTALLCRGLTVKN
jgi:hypothetical protein